MSSKYKAYAEYKDSGVEWLGEIPTHWDTNKLRYLFDFGKGLSITKENLQDEGIPCVNYGEIHSKYGFEVNPLKHPLKCVDSKYLKSTPSALLKSGDMIFADTSEDIDGSGNFTQLIGDTATFAGYHTIIARPYDRESNRFFAYLFDSQEFRTQIRHAVKGVKVFSITQAILRGLGVWLPPHQERKQIANFLDHETAKIDTLIEEQKTLIRLLQEKRQAVISHAVTKGLNPDAPMKDSGVEWFDQSPEHWKIGKLGYYAKITNGATPSRENMSYWTDGSIGWLNSSKVNDVYITEANQFITPLAVSKTSVQKVEPDDLVMAITGEGQTRGRVAICTIEATINQHLAAISLTSSEISYKYLFHYLVSQYERIRYESAGAGSTKGAITCGDIASFPVPVPSNKGQDEIVLYIEQKVSKFDILINLASEQVRLATERRTALISAAVTGKIDVRDWTPPAPQQEQQQEMALCN